MSIHDILQRMKSEQREDLQQEDKALGDYMGGEASLSTVLGIDNTSYLAKKEYLKKAKGWIYACVNSIADEIAGTDLFLRKFKNDEVEEIFDHEILDLLYKPNNVTTKFDLIKLTFQYLEQTGEAPWFLEFKGGKPVGIILLRPDRLKVKPGKGTDLIAGYTYCVYGNSGYKEIDLEPQEVVPLRYTDPNMPFRGKGPLQAAIDTVEIDDYSEQWNKKFFKNSATPNAAVETDKILSKEVREKLDRQIKQKYEGYENAHKTMVLEGGIKWKPINVSQKDMDFVEQQRFSRDKILAIFRVPRTVLGITDDVNRANAEATDYVFARRTIKPKLEGFIQQLNTFLLPLFDNTGTLYLEYRDPVPENIDQKLKIADGVQKGYLTINEARELLGYDAIDGGDELREPLSFAPVQNSLNTTIRSKGKKKLVPRSRKDLSRAVNKKGRVKQEIIKKIESAVREKITPLIIDSLRGQNKNNLSELFAGTEEEAKKKKLEFQAQQLRVGEEFERKFIAPLNTIFKEAEKTFKIKATRNQAVSKYLKKHVFRLAKQLVATTNDLLGKALAEGVANEESIPELKKRVSDLFENMESYRSERIARTEVISATNFATEEAYKVSDVVEAKEWLTFFDERTDDDCAELDGETVKLGGTFHSSIGDVQYPPLHPNCRCTLIPVVS